jgi:hypothetical protein
MYEVVNFVDAQFFLVSLLKATTTPSGLPMPTMLSSSSGSSAVSGTQNLGVAQNVLGIPNNQIGMGMAQPMGTVAFNNANNVGGNTNIGATVVGATGSGVAPMQVVGMGVGQGPISAANNQNVQGGHVVSHNVLPSLGQMSTNSVNAQAMMPTAQMPAVSSNVLQVPSAVATPPQQQPNVTAKYAKIWDVRFSNFYFWPFTFLCSIFDNVISTGYAHWATSG